MIDSSKLEWQLCYVRYNTAWFAPCEPWKVEGDDFDDAPYESNASVPYRWKGENDRYSDFYMLMYSAPMETPGEKFFNSPYSVDNINVKYSPWLIPDRWLDVECEPIFAGDTVVDFCKKINASGGTVYVPLSESELEIINGTGKSTSSSG